MTDDHSRIGPSHLRVPLQKFPGALWCLDYYVCRHGGNCQPPMWMISTSSGGVSDGLRLTRCLSDDGQIDAANRSECGSPPKRISAAGESATSTFRLRGVFCHSRAGEFARNSPKLCQPGLGNSSWAGSGPMEELGREREAEAPPSDFAAGSADARHPRRALTSVRAQCRARTGSTIQPHTELRRERRFSVSA
jgi:hypothetical protein